MTGGVKVPEYPMPMSEVTTSFRAASSRRAVRTSRSVRPDGRARGSPARMEAGTAASSNSSRSATPIVDSMPASWSSSGPMWRRANSPWSSSSAKVGRVGNVGSSPVVLRLVPPLSRHLRAS